MIPSLSASQNPTSGLRDLSNQSGSGAAAGTVGSVVNNFALGGSKLSAETGGGGTEGKVLLWLGIAGAVIFLLIRFKKI